MRVLPVLACCIAVLIAGSGTPTEAQQSVREAERMTPERWANASPRERGEMVRELVGTCDFRERRITARAGSSITDGYSWLLSQMLWRDLPECPAAAAIAFIRAAIGVPERTDVDLSLLRLGWEAAERGQGMAPDPALADRYGRMLWLFDAMPPDLPRWPEAERQAWLVRPETVALLRARVSDRDRHSARSRELLIGLLLSRDFAGYDPEEAVALLERTNAYGLRISRLLTDGEHLPPDYARAARILIRRSQYSGMHHIPYQGELLNVGRRAAAAARTPVEQARALRLLSAATLEEYFSMADSVSALVRGIGPVAEAVLAREDAQRVARTTESRIRSYLPYMRRSEVGASQPTVLRALIGPDGRMVTTEVVQSSGAASVDHMIRAMWLPLAAALDLSATAQGRFVWVTLPPVERCGPCGCSDPCPAEPR